MGLAHSILDPLGAGPSRGCRVLAHTDARSCPVLCSLPLSPLGARSLGHGRGAKRWRRRKMTVTCACRLSPLDVQDGDCNSPRVAMEDGEERGAV